MREVRELGSTGRREVRDADAGLNTRYLGDGRVGVRPAGAGGSSEGPPKVGKPRRGKASSRAASPRRLRGKR